MYDDTAPPNDIKQVTAESTHVRHGFKVIVDIVRVKQVL
jgi:hypothetical protein